MFDTWGSLIADIQGLLYYFDSGTYENDKKNELLRSKRTDEVPKIDETTETTIMNAINSTLLRYSFF